MKARKILPVIFSLAGGAGVIVISYLTAKTTFKIAWNNKDEKLSKKEFIKKYWKDYIPALVSGSITIASIASSCIIGKSTEASLSSACIALNQGYNKYKDKVKDVLGLDKHEQIMTEIAKDELKEKNINPSYRDGLILCHEEHIGWFETTPETLALAYADLNQRLMCYDYGKTAYYSMLYNFVNDHDIHLLYVDKDDEELNKSLMWGWSSEYLWDTYGYCWIHMACQDSVTDDGQEFKEIIKKEKNSLFY